MITHISTIQELTLQLYETEGAWEYFSEEKDMPRDQIFNMIENWSQVFEEAHEGYLWDGDYYDEIDRFLEYCISEHKAGRFPTAESFLQKRVTIGYCVTSGTQPLSGVLKEFPKRDEDMDHGSEDEVYYSLREMTDEILSLEVGQSTPFKLRDDHDSVGSVTRLK